MVTVREATFDDYEQIVSLICKYDMPFKSYENWKHIWEGNPHCANAKSRWTIGWVLENDSDELCGYLGNIPLLYELNGKKLIIASGHVWVVDIAYRQHSILLINQYFNQTNADILLNTTAGNERTRKVFSAYKAQQIPVESYDVSYFRITNYHHFLYSFIKKKKALFINLFSYLLYPLLKVVDKTIKAKYVLTKTPSEICCYDNFTNRFDVFWEKLKKNNNKLLCVRDSKSLNWHFKYALIDNKIWILVREKEEKIIGYAILMRDDKKEINLKKIQLVDLQVMGEIHKTTSMLIMAALRRCYREDIHMLEMIGFNAQKRDIARKYLPFKRKLTVLPFYKVMNSQLEYGLKNPDIWDISLYDGDGSL